LVNISRNRSFGTLFSIDEATSVVEGARRGKATREASPGSGKTDTQLGECSRADVVFWLTISFLRKFPIWSAPMSARLLLTKTRAIVDEDPSAHGDGTVSLAMSEFSDGALGVNPVRHTKGDQTVSATTSKPPSWNSTLSRSAMPSIK
jgi:hypothetical protein